MDADLVLVEMKMIKIIALSTEMATLERQLNLTIFLLAGMLFGTVMPLAYLPTLIFALLSPIMGHMCLGPY